MANRKSVQSNTKSNPVHQASTQDGRANSHPSLSQKQLLSRTVEHIDIKSFDARPIMAAYGKMAFQARNLARATDIYNAMLSEKDGMIFMGLAGSLVSAGLKKVILDLMENNMVDSIVSTGAILVDQDFFEGLGYKHYQGDIYANDETLRQMHVDRIYDTYINEDELRICDETIGKIADSLETRPYSSREFLWHMGAYLKKHGKNKDSIVLKAYEKDIPLFVPAFSDCSAGFGLVLHQHNNPKKHVSIDSAADFLECTRVKLKGGTSGLLMIGGGVPKNFLQDTVVAGEVLGHDVAMHKYAVQLTVADERDGALSGSTLKEAHSWGKVDEGAEQMVFGEATVTLPLLASAAYHGGAWKTRTAKKFNQIFK
ncbi:deoxyhypusine synthase [Candidatus Micrarchaeota archaeon]|nr:deoxyhypusine synthase [Candidatus Micrarchaeota archaeon]